ncbi:hypothetical protein GIY30_12195 [Gordonia sp. HNM0687]|uniref:Nitroreductase family deazaflavin-dependent oxidoreductase n=1 Tax=Gordonia mangrovi TaxID=2665643 RepID=A0A6L7GQE0_9ACTN|nr:hypothetical protein [Gordonia mangrovi]MXP22106.1 hypothetical protein [Gordonia mangrovi]UVF77975.1 hypothetical protein NWF22_22545 [Gordonia mangrovi]
MNRFQRMAAMVNGAVVPVLRMPGIRTVVGGSITLISYTGRKSGNRFELPVGYRRSGDTVTIGVAMPDKKGWWRNFTGAGAPISLTLDGTTRTGHAVSRRDDQGAVSVRVDLDPAP